MLDLTSLQLIATIGTGIVAFLVQFGVLIWRFGKAQSAIQERIVEVEHSSESERFKIRQELLEAKLDLSNDFVKKETFQVVMNNIDSRLIRLEAKLDSAISQLPHG